MQDVRPDADVIDLREIHLARQSSLQVPVGHISVPGGIKLCSPGTFWVANYLIINNGSCQVNFTKPNSATIRNTNSQWLREDATEVPVGREAVPKTGLKSALPREDAHEVPVGLVSLLGQSHEPEPEGLGIPLSYLWTRSSCRRTVRRMLCHAGMALRCLWARSPCRRPVRSPPSPRRDASDVLLSLVAAPKEGR